MALAYDHARQPPEGHYLADPTGHIIRTKTLRELAPAIALFRKQNGLPPGNPSAEIEQFYLKQFPWLVSKLAPPPAATEDPVKRWLNRAWRAPVKSWANSEATEQRMGTCVQCQYYVADYAFDQDATRRLAVLAGGRLKPAGACKVHHWACGLTALMDNPGATIAVEGCWAAP